MVFMTLYRNTRCTTGIVSFESENIQILDRFRILYDFNRVLGIIYPDHEWRITHTPPHTKRIVRLDT